MKSGEMEHEMTIFHTMGLNRNVLFQTHLLFVTKYVLIWSSSVRFLKQDDAGSFESPLLLCTLLYLSAVTVVSGSGVFNPPFYVSIV